MRFTKHEWPFSIPRITNSQLVCLSPVEILNLVMFIWIFIYHCLFKSVLKSPSWEMPITYRTITHATLVIGRQGLVSLKTWCKKKNSAVAENDVTQLNRIFLLLGEFPHYNVDDFNFSWPYVVTGNTHFGFNTRVVTLKGDFWMFCKVWMGYLNITLRLSNRSLHDWISKSSNAQGWNFEVSN